MSKLLYLILFSCLVLGCQQTQNYDYWVTHIKELQEKYAECQQNDTPHCAEIKRAASDVGQLIYEQTTDPEAFGKKILALQESLKKNSQADHDEQLKQLKIMYAIVGLHGPE